MLQLAGLLAADVEVEAGEGGLEDRRLARHLEVDGGGVEGEAPRLGDGGQPHNGAHEEGEGFVCRFLIQRYQSVKSFEFFFDPNRADDRLAAQR